MKKTTNFWWCPRCFAYLAAVLLPFLTLLVRLAMGNLPQEEAVLNLFLIPILFCAYVGGLGPGLVATAVSVVISDYFLLAPLYHFSIADSLEQAEWYLLIIVGVLISSVIEVLHHSRRRISASENLQKVTLASIGDAVITTDSRSGVTFINQVAEELTGWKNQEAVGKLLAEVFHIISEKTRESVEDPVWKVLKSGVVIGLANHTILISRDGREIPIDDSGAPIRNADGTIVGVVLVFRDCTARRKAEADMQERLALEEQLAGILATAPGVVCTFQRRPDGSSCFPYSSPAIKEIFGIEVGELVNDASPVFKQVSPDDIAHLEQTIAESARTMSVWRDEFRVHHAQRGEVWVEGCSMPQRLADGSVLWHGFIQDITSRKRAEEKAQEGELRLGSLFQHMREGFAYCRMIFENGRPVDFEYLQVNSAFSSLTGLKDVVGKKITEITPSVRELHPDLFELYGRVALTGQSEHLEMYRKDLQAWLRLSVYSTRKEYFAIIFENITQRKHSEQALLESKALYHSLVEQMAVGVFRKNAEGRFVFVNSHLCQMHHLSPADFLGQKMSESPVKDDALKAQAENHHAEILRTGRRIEVEESCVNKDGKTTWFHAIKSPVYDIAGNVIGTQGIIFDVTQAREVEESNRRLATAVESAAEDILVTDPTGTIVYVNPAFERITGYTRQEIVGQNPRMLKSNKHDSAFYREMWETLLRGEIWSGHIVNRKKDGSCIEEEATISPIRDAGGKTVNFVAVRRDVTREVALEAQLRHAQKMDAVGQLAGGVAHDFNNLLTVIRGNVALLQMQGPLTDDQAIGLIEVAKAAERATSLTRQLLLFSRQETIQARNVDLNDIVTNMAKMLRRVLGEDIQMQLKFEPHPLFIHADAGMMDQVIMNLAVNSRDAMPRGGRLVIETTAVEFDETSAAQSPRARPGSFVCLSVSDTGCGIPAEILPRIFDPFFTTKDVGKGTGLGLATVFGIVQQHQGWISPYSQPGSGTTFRVYLPRANKGHVPNNPVTGFAAMRRGTEGVLLVEDEAPVRRLVKKILTRLGYQVFEVPDGVAALEVWKQNQKDIQLLLTDLVMPQGLNGKNLAQQLLRESPRLKVIYASGYSADIADDELALQEGVNFLAKPFEAQRLALAVRAMLDS
ncbi:MAG: PAS domain S-box protein [Limisphaerales bacterium]